MITPTIGRVVWYWPEEHHDLASGMLDKDQPWSASITFVHSDTEINVAGFTHTGKHFKMTHVLLHQGEGVPETRPVVTWMPYQKGQAAKTEQLEKQLPP